MTSEKIIPTPEQLRSLLDYNPETGVLLWKEREPWQFSGCKNPEHSCKRWNAVFSGRPAGARHSKGYWVVVIFRHHFKAHRVVWAWVTGKWPDGDIDHINRGKSDNRWRNLRLATSSQNMANRGISKASSTGVKGVTFHKATGKWLAQIRVNNLQTYLGVFENLGDAATAYENAAKLHFGEYACISERAGF